MITILPEVTQEVGVPRTLHVPFKLGRPCGEPFDFHTRKRVVLRLLDLTAKPSGTFEEFDA
ncbi:hypothetical protein EFBL_2630 [Effusibacillus lacus]|uniref:Uncharacterized protein n=1 Tax=Effusibacillus lacus TaxID=1348429 RepID=A0A292YR64_9BACL|nr:hypothetical protein EFBL_2630 [Effusibacillus lacus]